MRIYLISHYDEYGSEDVRGTADRDALPAFIDGYVRNVWLPACRFRGEARPDENEIATLAVDEALKQLGGVLPKAEANPGDHFDLGGGWGGLQIHVVDVTPDK